MKIILTLRLWHRAGINPAPTFFLRRLWHRAGINPAPTIFLRLWAMVLLLLLLASPILAWSNNAELKKEILEKESVVRQNPASADARFDLAITYAYTNRIEDGLNELTKTAQLAGDKKKYSRALIEKYYPLVGKSKNDWKIRFRLAFAYYFGGYTAYAKAELKNITLTTPGNPWPYGYMAIISADENKWDEAVSSMKKAISIDSNVAAFHLGLSQAYYKLNMPFPAALEAGEAIRLRALGY